MNSQLNYIVAQLRLGDHLRATEQARREGSLRGQRTTGGTILGRLFRDTPAARSAPCPVCHRPIPHVCCPEG